MRNSVLIMFLIAVIFSLLVPMVNLNYSIEQAFTCDNLVMVDITPK